MTIKKIFKFARLKILLDTNFGLIIPIGFNSDLKGPNMIFLIFNFFFVFLSRRFFLKETSWPMRDLLIS